MPGSLVKEDPEPEPMPEQTIDGQVVEKGETFWGFLKSIFGAIAGVGRRVNGSKKFREFAGEVWQGKTKNHDGWLIKDLERKRKRK